MHKKLDEDKINAILETGIDEFAENGLDRSNINIIAKNAGVSVGVIYKYFGDKDKFFLECVKHSLDLLDEVLHEAISYETDIASGIKSIISALIKHSKEHANYNVLYNEISSGSCKQYAAELARRIEEKTAEVYSELLRKAKEAGMADRELDPKMFSFFMDNLFMMLQFSYSCDYYKERMKIFCGDDIFDDTEKMTEEFMRFVKNALKA